jgi:hypothetical protein
VPWPAQLCDFKVFSGIFALIFSDPENAEINKIRKRRFSATKELKTNKGDVVGKSRKSSKNA